MSDTRTAHRICPLCESLCGLRLSPREDQVLEVRGYGEDPLSDGYSGEVRVR